MRETLNTKKYEKIKNSMKKVWQIVKKRKKEENFFLVREIRFKIFCNTLSHIKKTTDRPAWLAS